MPSQIYPPEAIAEPALGAHQTVLLSGADTKGAFSLVLIRLPPHSVVTPSHSHPWHSESYFVLSGMLAVTQDGNTITLRQGMAGSTPVGVTHTCWNPAATPLVALLHYTPGSPPEHALALAAAAHSAPLVSALTKYSAEEPSEQAI